MTKKTYIYDSVEVQLTGRVAQRKLSSGKIDELVEITPVDEIVGKWKKWVREVDLYEVKNEIS